MMHKLKIAMLSIKPLGNGWSMLRGWQQETLCKRRREYFAARRLLAGGRQGWFPQA